MPTIPASFIPWIILGMLALGTGVWFAGDWHGHSHENTKWILKMQKAAEKAQADHDAMQKQLDLASAEFEIYRTTTDKRLEEAEKELQHEISTNPAYDSCHVGDSFMRSYSQLAAGNTAVIP